MLCSQCGRDNQAGLDYCDYCGEPLAAAPAGKRKTEMDGGGGGGGKRKTAMDGPPPARDPFEAAMAGEVDDPFAPSSAGKPARKQESAPAAPAAAAKKRVTQFDQGDPFAPPGPVTDERYAGRRIVGFLITFDGHPDGKHWLIREGRNLVGRDAERCDIVISDDDKVSSQHAVLAWRAGRLRIADDKSQNGTFLDEEDVLQPEEVADAAVIRIGRTRLICRLLDAAQVEKLWKPAEA